MIHLIHIPEASLVAKCRIDQTKRARHAVCEQRAQRLHPGKLPAYSTDAQITIGRQE